MLLIEFILRQDLGLRFMIGRIFLFTGDGPFCWDGSQVIKSGCLLYGLREVSLFSWPIEQNAQDKQMRAQRSLNLKKKRLLAVYILYNKHSKLQGT